jgi:gas vesicle protein
MSKRKFGIGLVVGAVAGLVAGLLTAPKSGKETRQDIKKKAGDVSREAGKQVEMAKQKAGDVADQAKKTVDRVKEVTDSAVEGVKGGFTKGQSEVPAKKDK